MSSRGYCFHHVKWSEPCDIQFRKGNASAVATLAEGGNEDLLFTFEGDTVSIPPGGDSIQHFEGATFFVRYDPSKYRGRSFRLGIRGPSDLRFNFMEKT